MEGGNIGLTPKQREEVKQIIEYALVGFKASIQNELNILTEISQHPVIQDFLHSQGSPKLKIAGEPKEDKKSTPQEKLAGRKKELSPGEESKKGQWQKDKQHSSRTETERTKTADSNSPSIGKGGKKERIPISRKEQKRNDPKNIEKNSGKKTQSNVPKEAKEAIEAKEEGQENNEEVIVERIAENEEIKKGKDANTESAEQPESSPNEGEQISQSVKDPPTENSPEIEKALEEATESPISNKNEKKTKEQAKKRETTKRAAKQPYKTQKTSPKQIQQDS